MSDFDDAVSEWTDLLHLSPLFERLREKGTEVVKNGNLMCEIRGDLFVWSSAESAVFTTNLKRLKAHPSEEQMFQVQAKYGVRDSPSPFWFLPPSLPPSHHPPSLPLRHWCAQPPPSPLSLPSSLTSLAST